MTLREVLDQLPTGQKISVGANAGYMYVGSRGAFYPADYDYSNRQAIRFEIEKLESQKKKCNVVKFWKIQEYDEKIESARQKLENYVPLLDREVKEVFKRYYGGIAIIVEGRENGKAKDTEEMEPSTQDPELLINAIVQQAARDYAYCVARHQRLAGDALTAYHFFKSDDFVSLTGMDGKGILRQIREHPDWVIGERGKDGNEEPDKES